MIANFVRINLNFEFLGFDCQEFLLPTEIGELAKLTSLYAGKCTDFVS